MMPSQRSPFRHAEGSGSFRGRFTIIVVAGIVAMLVSPQASLIDAETGAPVTDVALHLPVGYVAVAPVSALLDTLSLLTVRQHVAFGVSLLLGALLLALLCRQTGATALEGRTARRRLRVVVRVGAFLIAALSGLLSLYVALTLLPRPMARLRVTGDASTRLTVVDFHSHTDASHDGRRGFTAEANRAWHRSAGFDVAYITNHREPEVTRSVTSDSVRAGDDIVMLSGVEYGYRGEHVVSLGDHAGTLAGDSAAPVVIHTIPEPLESVHARGVRGGPGVVAIEIADASPRGLEQAASDSDRILRLADSLDLAVVASSNNHGWGHSAIAWSLIDIPGWKALQPGALDSAIQSTILRRRRRAVRVVIRAPVPGSQSAIGLALTLPSVVWTSISTLPAHGRVITALWLGLILVVPALARERRRSLDAGVQWDADTSPTPAGA